MYQLVGGGVRRDDGATIPADMNNADWRAYQAWLSQGHTPQPADVSPSQPDVRGFEGALKSIFANDLQALNALMAKYPLFLWSLRDQNWAYVGPMLIGAHLAGDLSNANYAAIKAAAAEKSIPVTLS